MSYSARHAAADQQGAPRAACLPRARPSCGRAHRAVAGTQLPPPVRSGLNPKCGVTSPGTRLQVASVLSRPGPCTQIAVTTFSPPSLENRTWTNALGLRRSSTPVGMSGKLNAMVPTVKLSPDGLTLVTLSSSSASPGTGAADGATAFVSDTAIAGQARRELPLKGTLIRDRRSEQ
jgi:hypothetical protein